MRMQFALKELKDIARKKKLDDSTERNMDMMMDLTLFDRRKMSGERMIVEFPCLLKPGEVSQKYQLVYQCFISLPQKLLDLPGCRSIAYILSR